MKKELETAILELKTYDGWLNKVIYHDKEITWSFDNDDILDWLSELQRLRSKIAEQDDVIASLRNWNVCEKEEYDRITDKVKEYYLKIADGTLVELPCKVGDTVYYFDKRFAPCRGNVVIECTINEYSTDRDGTYAVLDAHAPHYAMRRFAGVLLKEFGKTAFLTQEAAEQARG